MFLKSLIQNRYPSLDWIQVEISSYCNANCIYCPHTAYGKNWQHRYLPINAFRNLIPAFRKTELVYLQGWGEPFTHPQFFEMLKLAKRSGCKVGTTTNGTLLNRHLIEKLVNEDLDIIGFSLAGIDEKNDRIREGTRIKAVLKSIEEIHKAKNKYRSDTPAIHIAYMLLRSDLGGVEKLPAFLSDAGADQTVVSSLSFAVNPAMEAESILAGGEKDYLELKHRLLDVRDVSAELGADVHFHLVSPMNTNFACIENIPRAVVIGSDGSVSPCVMKQIAVKGKNYHCVRGQTHLQQNLSFGNIQQESLNTIWHCKEYRQFIQKIGTNQAPLACQNCLKGHIDTLVKVV
jgi:MoaA/NifB/PqqE/SkfB family radical SAM enzyme